MMADVAEIFSLSNFSLLVRSLMRRVPMALVLIASMGLFAGILIFIRPFHKTSFHESVSFSLIVGLDIFPLESSTLPLRLLPCRLAHLLSSYILC